jgi:hypothetical protein
VHLPGFVQQAQDVTDKGVDRIVCVSVNDAFVMGAWGEDQGVGESIVMLADGNGAFTEAMGHVMDGSGFGLGIRSKRYAAIIDNGVITSLDIDETGGVEVVLMSLYQEPFDLECFHSVGIDPLRKRFVVIKSRVHWRAGLGGLASEVVECASPGVTTSDYSLLKFERVRRPVFPLDQI